MTGQTKEEARRAKFAALQSRLKKERQANREEVKAEQSRKDKPVSESKRRTEAWEEQETALKEQADKQGVDYQTLKLLNTTGEQFKRQEKKKNRKGVAPEGIERLGVNHKAAMFKKSVNDLQVGQEDYERQKAEQGEEFYRGSDSMVYGQHDKVDPSKVDDLVEAVSKAEQGRMKGRRKRYRDDKNVDHINMRNERFNDRLDRQYKKYVVDIKANLERGTAL